MARKSFIATVLSVSLLSSQGVHSQSNTALKAAKESEAIHVYAAPDDNTPPIGVLLTGESVTPVAESQGAGGVKWYLIKIKSGEVGWFKQSDSEQSKRVDNFFRSLPREAGGVSVDVAKTSAANAPRGSIMVPVNLSGGSMIVPVMLNRTLTANLLLDTGASMTMISRRMATSLALYPTRSGLISGIGGRVVAQIVRLDSIKVGDAEVNGMSISIHDISVNPQFDGLLGMDFLGRFQLSMDPAKSALILSPRESATPIP